MNTLLSLQTKAVNLNTQGVETRLNPLGDHKASNLLASIAMVLSAKKGKEIKAEDLSGGMRINEEELYSAIIHQQLKEKNPTAALAFETALPEQIAKIKTNKNSTLVFKATDRVMRAFVRSKQISHDLYRQTRDYAFGKAQMDSDRTWLAPKRTEEQGRGDTPLRAISTALNKFSENSPALAEEISAYRAREAAISRAKWKERRQAASSANSSDNAIAQNTSSSSNDIPSGFLWKPNSEKDNRLVILLPSTMTSSAKKVAILSPDGNKVLENGNFAGIGNGGRQHYRFSKAGGNYPAGAQVSITFDDGTKRTVLISNTANRVAN